MTGKADMVSVLDLPSHLSQPSRSENVPIFARGTQCRFAPENHDFGANPGKEKGNSQPHRASRRLPAVLPPADRCVASQGEGGVRDTTQPIWMRVGELFGAPKAKQEKGAASWTPRPGHFCPQCGQLRRSTSGVVEEDFRRAVGSRTEIIPQLREKLRGRGKIQGGKPR